jgi:hypothetical protein
MGWHADDEKELGPQPLIASLSFGASRDFLLREHANPPRRMCVALEHGSLLLMSGAVQHNWQHALPRRLRSHEARINLTFRRILHSSGPTGLPSASQQARTELHKVFPAAETLC